MEKSNKTENLTAEYRRDINSAIKLRRQFNAIIKRAFDIIASALSLIILSPFFALLALRIKHDSEGPVFYHAKRIGRNGKPFKMLKFRTMYETPASYNGPSLTSNNDNRITDFGQWLRDTKVNELPQLWNVLIGEMSLVGPRPEVLDFINKWPDDLRDKVLSVRPGMTSPASIIYRDEEKQLDGINFLDDYLKNIMPDKLRLDLLYVDTYSFAADLDVIFMTLIAILPLLRKVRFKEGRIFSGPLYGFFSHHLTWFLSDFLVTFFSVGVAGFVWRATQVINLGFLKSFILAFVIALIFSIISTFFGLHRIVWRYASPVLVIDVALSIILTALIIILGNRLLYKIIILPFDFILNYSLLMIIGLIGIRYRERLVTGVANRWINLRRNKKSLGERVLVVGAGAGGELAVWLLHKSEYSSAFSIAGYVDDDYRKQNAQMAGYPILGTTKDIPNLVQEHHIGLILFSISKISQSNRDRILSLCQQTGARVIVIPDLIEILKSPEEIIEENGA
ncbi:MAG: sugar transferase [Chloroflexota bacterium]|nr:sugar transferase [Chloroflexota bacterium]